MLEIHKGYSKLNNVKSNTKKNTGQHMDKYFTKEDSVIANKQVDVKQAHFYSLEKLELQVQQDISIHL